MLYFILINLTIYYFLIFNNCLVNFNFEFIIEIKSIIAILKIISLMGHKVYEISLMRHSYHFFGIKKKFSLNNLYVMCDGFERFLNHMLQ